MSSNRPVVVLDACVLYPASLRNVMMWLAVHDVICARWTDAIHDEWTRSVLANNAELTSEQLARTRRMMDEHSGDSIVTGYEKHIQRLLLPDPDDRHVLAAAVESKAEAIITWNLKDFPVKQVALYGIEVQTPDEFILGLLETNQLGVLKAMREHRASLTNPAKTVTQYLENLAQQGLRNTVEALMNLTQQL